MSTKTFLALTLAGLSLAARAASPVISQAEKIERAALALKIEVDEASRALLASTAFSKTQSEIKAGLLPQLSHFEELVSSPLYWAPNWQLASMKSLRKSLTVLTDEDCRFETSHNGQAVSYCLILAELAGRDLESYLEVARETLQEGVEFFVRELRNCAGSDPKTEAANAVDYLHLSTAVRLVLLDSFSTGGNAEPLHLAALDRGLTCLETYARNLSSREKLERVARMRQALKQADEGDSQAARALVEATR